MKSINTKKFFGGSLLFLTAALSLSACGNSVTVQDSPAVPVETINATVDTAPLPETEYINTDADSSEDGESNWDRQPDAEFDPLFERLCDDLNIAEAERDVLAAAVKGSQDAQIWIRNKKWLEKPEGPDRTRGNDWIWVIFPDLANSKVHIESECIYNIGNLYYGNRYTELISLELNKKTALEWYKLSALRGSANGAVMAGDMLKDGDGIEKNDALAFKYYSMVQGGIPFARIAECYRDGIGVAADSQMAYSSYLDSAFLAYPPALYQLTKFGEKDGTDLIALYKAAGSTTRSGGYFAVAYGGIEANAPDEAKRELTDYLCKVWDTKADSAVKRPKILSNEAFPKDFAEELVKASYAYAYHVFAQKYALPINRIGSESADIQFRYDDDDNEFSGYEESQAESYLKSGLEYYEYDFNQDGKLEIGVPIHSGAGGAFMYDGFGIFQKNDGLYELIASGPGANMTDGMRIIEYKGRIYFITNPFSKYSSNADSITAYTIDSKGGHEIVISWRAYQMREVMTQTAPEYTNGYGKLLSNTKNVCGIN